MPIQVNEEGQVVIGEGEDAKTLSEEQITSLMEQGSKVEELSAIAEKVKQATGKYDVDLDTYLQQAEGSFSTIGRLLEEGVIDEKGEIKLKKESAEPEPKPDPKGSLKTFDTKGLVGEERIAAIVAKTVQEHIKPLTEGLDQVKQDITNDRRREIEGLLRRKHEGLDEYDVQRIMGTAMNDQSKSVWEHADTYAKDKSGREAKMKAKWMEEMGIDPEDWEERNKMKGMSPAEGMAAVASGKKISFDSRRRHGKDAVTPRTAMAEFFRRQREG